MRTQLADFARLFPLLLSNFRSSPARQIDLELSNRCNLKCQMCWFHGEGGIGDCYQGSELTTAEVLNFISQIADYRPSIYLGGCEPFIRVDLLRILQHLKDLGLAVAFTTNGTLLDSAKNLAMVQLGVDQIIFSLDGPEEVHDEIRGKGVFRKATANLKELSDFRRHCHRPKPVISVNMTITPFIIGRLLESIEAIREATGDGADCYRVHHLWFITPKELALHQSAVRQYLKCSAPGAACHLTPLAANINPSALSREIEQLKNLPKIQFFPNLSPDKIYQYYSEGGRTRRRCFAPYQGAVIKPNGDVKFCPDDWIDDYLLGNIRENNFADIWNNRKARNFRSVIFRQKAFPGCKRCSWRYCY
jgi:radical SAM protein with 4Fe4S-binding SPASM domain